jgi:hypothetical protein
MKPFKSLITVIAIKQRRYIPLLIVCLFALLSGCSTYKSNSSITFESANERLDKPVIYVGELTEEANEFSYVGWIDAKVSKANVFSDKPTKAMADRVLAYLAKQRGAHAVTYVTYKYGIFGAIEARGQAVRVNSISDIEVAQQKIAELKEQEALARLAQQEQQQQESEDSMSAIDFILSKTQVAQPVVADAEATVTVSPVKQALLYHSTPAELVHYPKPEIDRAIERLNRMRDEASQAKSFERYQALTEVIEILKQP